MKVTTLQNRDLVLQNFHNTQNENDVSKITLEVPKEYETFNKKIVFITPDGIFWDLITNNEYVITTSLTQYKEVDFYIWLTHEDQDFRSKTKTIRFYSNKDASEQITSEQINGVNTICELLDEEIQKVENINITASKVGTTATISITNKDGETTNIEIEDGEQGATGQNGQDGQDGYTPVKGVDYWTTAEQQDIVDTATTNTINNYSSTINEIQTTVNRAESIAKGCNQALSYSNYQAMVTALNNLGDDKFLVGQNIMIITLEVPDLWVSSVETNSVQYTFTNDEAITTALSTNGYIQVGYYKLSPLETQKVNLTNYVEKTSFVYDSNTETLTITI